VILSVLVTPFVFPALWVFMASFSTNNQITLNPLALPDRLRFENYVYAWTQAKMGRYVFNSLFVAVTSATAITCLATCLGYALARLEFPGKRIVLAVVLSAIIMPVFSYVVPLAKLAHTLRLSGMPALILTTVAVFLPVPTLLMRSLFKDMSEELADAARVEGANEWLVFRHVMVPLARSGMLTALIFGFVWAWNDLLLPVVFLHVPESMTIPYGIAALRPADFRQDYVSVFAGSMLSTIPMIIIYVFLMRRFIKGLSAGGLKF
jgi:ABC-type glycerol-3-phosphate transport system permease component